jgi:hypothetical protein
VSFTIGPAPGIPGQPSARQDGGTLTLAWRPPTSGGTPTRYLVAAGSAPGTADLGIFDAGAGTSLTAEAPPGTYFTRVFAMNATGQSPASSELALTLGEIPALLAPAPDAVVRQNDPASGCPPHPTRGFGFRTAFDWTDVIAAREVAGYQIILKGPTAANPLIGQHVVTSELVFTSCNGHAAFNNSFNWEWRVRTVDSEGRYGAWSPPRRLHFGPCQLANGDTCYASGDASGPPSYLEAIVEGSRVSLTWLPPVSGAAPFSYVIEAGSLPGASDLAILDTASDTPSFVATQVGPGRYFVRVRARTYGGTSAPSNEIRVDVP